MRTLSAILAICVGVAAVLGASGASAQAARRDEVLSKLGLCDNIERRGDWPTATSCRDRVFNNSGALAALSPEEQQSFLWALARGMDQRAQDACQSAWRDRLFISRAAVSVWSTLIGVYKLECGAGRSACTDSWRGRIPGAMDLYVKAMLREAAIREEGTDEVTTILSQDVPLSFLNASLMLLWEKGLCSCSLRLRNKCGEGGSACRERVTALCVERSCNDQWCDYGDTLTRLGVLLPGSFAAVRRSILSSGQCGREAGGGR